jgi:hypothetical protein
VDIRHVLGPQQHLLVGENVASRAKRKPCITSAQSMSSSVFQAFDIHSEKIWIRPWARWRAGLPLIVPTAGTPS